MAGSTSSRAPGAGKTSTLCGLLAVLCQSHGFDYDRAFASMRIDEAGDHRGGAAGAQARRQGGSRPRPGSRRWTQGKPRESCLRVPKNEVVTVESSREGAPRVLVCTPNNAALDEVCVRVAKTGLKDELGYPFHPKIVRVGVKHQISEEARPTRSTCWRSAGQRGVAVIFSSTLGRSEGVPDRVLYAHLRRLHHDPQLAAELRLHHRGRGRAGRGAHLSHPTGLLWVPQVLFGWGPRAAPSHGAVQKGDRAQYRKSLFERLQSCGHAPLMLTRQYRMPEIRSGLPRNFTTVARGRGGLEEALRPGISTTGSGPTTSTTSRAARPRTRTRGETRSRRLCQSGSPASWQSTPTP